MVSACKDFVNIPGSEVGYMLELVVDFLLLFEAELSKLTIAASEDVAFLREHKTVIPTCCYF